VLISDEKYHSNVFKSIWDGSVNNEYVWHILEFFTTYHAMFVSVHKVREFE